MPARCGPVSPETRAAALFSKSASSREFPKVVKKVLTHFRHSNYNRGFSLIFLNTTQNNRKRDDRRWEHVDCIVLETMVIPRGAGTPAQLRNAQ